MVISNFVLKSNHRRHFWADVYLPEHPKAVVVFSHGFKGFKDWGNFPQIAKHFAAEGFCYIAFNFSHNGTTIDNPTDFADLEAFGNNNFTKELDDLGVVIDFVSSRQDLSGLPIFLLGHSRGGGISILKAKEDERVKKVAVWGSVNQFGKFWKNNEIEIMKRDGAIYVSNARTNQLMPVYRQLYDDYEMNLERLFIPDAVKTMWQPLLIVHGSADETIPVEAAKEMHTWNNNSKLVIIENANHTFGGKHPWVDEKLPEHTLVAIQHTVNFFKQD